MGAEVIGDTLNQIADFNPPRVIRKGSIAPFVDMAALPTNGRDVAVIAEREYQGGGSKFKNGDTLFARITPCLENGKTAKMSGLKSNQIAHGSTEFIVISAKEPEYDENFIYYLARLPEFRLYAEKRMEGTSGRQRVSWQAIESFPLKLPDKKIRAEIGNILSSVDNKIELNQRMNETLEAMARALFKSWFVDFDPVRAKAEGRTPEGMDAATAALFPATFNYNGLPEGWSKVSVSDIGEIVTGKTPSTKNTEYYGDDIPFITIPDMHNRIFVTECGKYLSEKGADSQKNKYLPVGSICISCIATPGLTILTHEPCQTNQQINAVIPSNTELSNFRYWQLKGMSEEVISKGSGGSVFHNLNKSQFSALKIIEPNIEVATLYEGTVTPIMDRILFNQKQSITLSQLRDTLLPKLISGELRIGDLEDRMREAG